MKRTTIAAVVLAGLTAAGCNDPYASRGPSATTPTSTVTVAAPDRAQADGAAARATARAFARRWVNWTWLTAARQQRQLARLATGDLAATLLANARSALVDQSLERDQPGSTGSIAGIDVTLNAGHASGVLVTREAPLSGEQADIGERRYRVYLVELQRTERGWGVSRWAPQP